MKNPLMKRLPREFAGDMSKYIAIFVMMVLLISICSGMQVGNESLKAAYYESMDLYNIEDGHITFDKPLTEELTEIMEKKLELQLYDSLYFEEDIAETGATVRVYQQTDERNNPCLLQGSLPVQDSEIAVDRVFAKNNGITCGDTITLKGKELTVTGLIALPNYSTLFENNTDSMFDSINFSVAVMAESGFDEIKGKNIHYNYAWVYDVPYTDDIEAAERSEKVLDILEEVLTEYNRKIMTEQTEGGEIIMVEDYLPRYLNQAVGFSIEDIGGDEATVTILSYMMIIVIAFIFAVTISNTIVSEASVIGTLRASGYTRGELVRHYMLLPMVVTLVAAIVGNIMGYTILKDYFVKLYRDSYSLTTYRTLWNPSAFVLSTVVPLVLMLFINLTVLSIKLRLTPLKFLKHDLRKNRSRKAMRLNTKIPFRIRFSLRIFFNNLPGYFVMIIGILFGAVLICFGDMLPRMIDSYREIIVRDMISEYQYVLYDGKTAKPVTDGQAEKYASLSFDYSKEGFLTDGITVYGIEENSRYVTAQIPDKTVFISTGVSEKFGLKEGDVIKLDEKYKRDVSYEIRISGVYEYQSSLAVFMNIQDFNEIFRKDAEYFTGYFSDRKLEELSEDDVLAVITADDYTKLSDQLMVSMGGMMDIIRWFGAIFFVIVVYVLCKQVIQRNFQSIALTKILGFRNGEIGGFYIVSTSLAVIVGLILSVPFVDVAMRAIFQNYLYTMMTGYIPYIVSPITYVITVLTGLLCYMVVVLLQMRKVSKVEKSEALKNVE